MAETKKTTAKAAEEVKATAKKVPAKKTTTAKKEATVKKEAAPKKATTAKKTTKKAAVQEVVNFQFSGKSYTPDDLLKSCKDVWKYDLGGKEEDLKSVELYVKPEENTAYYVINDEITGSFFI